MRIRTNIILLLIAIAIRAIPENAAAQTREPTWGAALFGTRIAAVNGPQFEVAGITEQSGKLIGYCMLANVQSGTYDPVKLVIKGKWRQGVFWPTIVSQVGNEYTGPWRTVRRQPARRESATLVVKPGEVVTEMRVNLEPFRKYIGRYEVGRILLPSGDGGVFELRVLNPPEKPPPL